MEFFKHRLENGLEIIAERNAHAHSTAVGFFVNTGSRDESDDVAGVSHFLEHMAFKGTPTRTAEDVNREFDEIGAHYNAFTSEENTVYYAAVLPEYQNHAVEILGDITRPSLREEDFKTEKQVILEEIQMYEDQPPFGADDRCKALHFGAHPLARSVLGTVESITALPVEAMRVYFAEQYGPATITVVASGRVDFDSLVGAVDRQCGQWEPVSRQREYRRPTPGVGFECMQREVAVQEYVLQMAAAPAADDSSRFAAKLLSTILGDDSGSRLYWELVDSGLAENASLSHYEYDDTGLFMAYMSCEPEHTEANLARMTKIFQASEQSGFTAEELSQAKSKISSRVVLASERPRGRLFTVGANWLHRGKYRSIADDLESVDGVTLAEMEAVLGAYPLTRCLTVAIGPLASLSRPE